MNEDEHEHQHPYTFNGNVRSWAIRIVLFLAAGGVVLWLRGNFVSKSEYAEERANQVELQQHRDQRDEAIGSTLEEMNDTLDLIHDSLNTMDESVRGLPEELPQPTPRVVVKNRTKTKYRYIKQRGMLERMLTPQKRTRR